MSICLFQQTLPVQEAPDVSLSNISVEGLNINLEDITPEMLSNLVVQVRVLLSL